MHPSSLQNACPAEQGQQCSGKRFHFRKTDPIILIHNQNVIQHLLEKSLLVIGLMTREIRASCFTHTFHLYCLCEGGIGLGSPLFHPLTSFLIYYKAGLMAVGLGWEAEAGALVLILAWSPVS